MINMINPENIICSSLISRICSGNATHLARIWEQTCDRHTFGVHGLRTMRSYIPVAWLQQTWHTDNFVTSKWWTLRRYFHLTVAVSYLCLFGKVVALTCWQPSLGCCDISLDMFVSRFAKHMNGCQPSRSTGFQGCWCRSQPSLQCVSIVWDGVYRGGVRCTHGGICAQKGGCALWLWQKVIWPLRRFLNSFSILSCEVTNDDRGATFANLCLGLVPILI